MRKWLLGLVLAVAPCCTADAGINLCAGCRIPRVVQKVVVQPAVEVVETVVVEAAPVITQNIQVQSSVVPAMVCRGGVCRARSVVRRPIRLWRPFRGTVAVSRVRIR